MRVLFSPSYQLELDPKQAANREPYPPLGTLYAASRLREDGHEVALSDSMLARGTAEFRRDYTECSKGGKLDEDCMKRRGWVAVTAPKAEEKPSTPQGPAYRPR